MKTQGLRKMEKRVTFFLLDSFYYEGKFCIFNMGVSEDWLAFGTSLKLSFAVFDTSSPKGSQTVSTAALYTRQLRESSPTTFIIILLYSTIFSGGPSWFDGFFYFSCMTVCCCADCTAPLISFSSFTVGETAFSFPLTLHSCLKSKMTNWQDSICCFSTCVFS